MNAHGSPVTRNGTLIPADYQPPLPMDRLVRAERPAEDAVPFDVLFVGGGPAGLAGSIALARAARDRGVALSIGVLERAERLGDHCLSGAVVNPIALRQLFPELPEDELPLRGPVLRERVHLLRKSGSLRIPTPPTMRNHGNRIASVCELVRWLGERAAELGVDVLTGFPADCLLVEGRRVLGVRTTPAGLDRDGEPGAAHLPSTDIAARITVLAEGTRGALTQAFLHWQGIGRSHPQIYALGVKELWRPVRPLDAVVHTLGWPLPRDVFGGSFFYPMADDLVALGLVVGLDYPQQGLDVHGLLQQLKLHPLFRPHLEGGELLEWGAKTIPEGGWYALPERRYGDGLLIVGDAAGFVDVPSLKGIHYAIRSGVLAAEAALDALEHDDPSAARLGLYDELVRESYIERDLYRTRGFRLGFKHGLYRGGFQAALLTATRGALPFGRGRGEADAATPRRPEPGPPDPDWRPDGKLTFSKEDAVYRSGNDTRDDIPSHLIWNPAVPPPVARFYARMCPAGVYEVRDARLHVNPSNCVDCKATDVLGPRWTPREGGAGTKYDRM
ncbi:MAG: electron-transfer flavoprotein:ubiquinone oxidoreductase [Myxococcota bacterium]